MSLQMGHLYKFDIFRVDVAERRLLRDGKVMQLAPKAFDALVVLVESGGRVLERGEMIKRIWPDSDAGEANLAVMISSLRKLLGERPDGGLYIETVPKQGYRFAVSVTELIVESGETEAVIKPSVSLLRRLKKQLWARRSPQNNRTTDLDTRSARG